MKPARFLHLVAHRGDAAGHPENTLPAFEAALELGVRFIEVDTQVAANGVPVAIRDALISADGIMQSVMDLTAAEISQIDASDPMRFGAQFAGTCVPRLVDVLSLLTRRPETTVFVTIGRASIAQFGHAQVTAHVAEALKPFRARCIVVSADLPAVHRSRQMASFPIGWTIASFDNHTRIKCEALQPEFIFVDRAVLPERAQLWRGPWRWVVRDVPALDVALDLAARGADFVATGDARSLGEAMRAHAALLAPAKALESAATDHEGTIARSTIVPRIQPR